MSDKKDDWKVTSKSGGGVDLLGTFVSLGTGIALADIATGNDPVLRDDYKYTVEDKYGNQHTVYAKDSDELGEKISRGDFDDD